VKEYFVRPTKQREASYFFQKEWENLKLLTWNTSMKFREKISQTLFFSPDILIIPECEAPEKWGNNPFREKIHQFHWFGDNPNKGIGVISLSRNYTLELHPLYTDKFKYIIPLKVSGNEEFNLIAIWTQLSDKKFTSYIGQIYLALLHYKNLLNESCILAGDWNSNKIFDHIKRVGTHSEVVNLLQKYRIDSTYHSFFNENHGEESIPTHYFRKSKESPFHLDFIFASESFTKRVKKIEVGKYDDWIKYSDHVPMYVEF
jgi:exonuclease III